MDQTVSPRPVSPRRRRGRIAALVAGLFVVLVVAVVLLWNWDWFIPIVQSQASATLGRKVTMAHLHVRLGRQTTVAGDDVVIANPDGFRATAPLAHVGRLTVVADIMDYVRHGAVVLPEVIVEKPDIHMTSLPDGTNNWTIKLAAKPGAKASPPPQIGDLQINDGTAHVVDPKHRSDFTAAIATRPAAKGEPAAITVDAHGTYAAQPVTARFVGGALLTLRDARQPYPIDLHVANGPTKASLVGTVANPLNFAGARLTLSFAGPDMALLFPLTGIPIPQTPPFSIAGKLDYAPPRIRLTGLRGRVGSSDLEGDIAADPRDGSRPDVVMDLRSQRVDLADLGGFIGAPAGRADKTAGETATQKAELAKAKSSKALFSSTTISLPKIRAADIHLKYQAEHIENKYTPFDRLVVAMDIVDGKIDLHPLDFVVGNGNITSNIVLDPGANDVFRTKADVQFQHIELQRLMQATHSFKGAGLVGGEARLDTHGNSMASMMGQGNGELKLVLVSAGDVSALLVDIAGLEFGNALLSAIGVPNRAKIDCFVTDLPLHDGIIDTKAFLLDTEEGRVTGTGTIDLRQQTLNYRLTTRAKHFSVGSLPGPILISGPITSPSIRPGAEIVARAGVAAGLGIVLTPLGALLPTIQFGVGNDNACAKAETAEREPLKVPRPSTRHVHK